MRNGDLVATFLTVLVVGLICVSGRRTWAEESWVVFDGFDGPGKGMHIVFVSGDEEYRSEESMPQLAKILAVRHGFRCTVLFAIDYTNSGKPIVGLRTATHAFNYVENTDSPYAKYSFRDREFKGGFGRQVLGETWINHYGIHNKESTRGIIAADKGFQPLVRGCDDIWGPSDVYALTTLEGDCQPVVLGQVLEGMRPDDPPNLAKKPIPVAWTKTYSGAPGKKSRVFTTTMGHSFDFKSEGFRRLLVNACYWALGMEDQIPAKSEVDLVGEYNPSDIGVGKHKKGLKPKDHTL